MSTRTVDSFADLLRGQRAAADVRTLSRYVWQAAIPFGAALALALVWCATAPLSGAVIAPAQLKVELNRKTVQHQEGGIVREVLVRDGQRVQAGQPLVVVGDVRNDAALQLVQDQLHAELIRKARATAEAAFDARIADVVGLPRTPAIVEFAARERALFDARRRMLDEQAASLQAQARDVQSQVAALQSRLDATEKSAKLAGEEVQINERLVQQGFVHRTRMISLERTEADSRAHVAEYRSDVAAARQRIGDLQARIVQARAQYQSQAADELRDAAARIRALEERLRPSQDQVERQVVRAPVDGEVMALRVSAPGAVIGPREAILDIVPSREKIVVEARIRPQDIDHVREGGEADVRLGAFDARDTPLLPGTVGFVSPDRLTNSNGDAFFVATIAIDGSRLAAHPELRLSAGMPAEVYVKTPERTVLAYLAKSLRVFSDRSMREP